MDDKEMLMDIVSTVEVDRFFELIASEGGRELLKTMVKNRVKVMRTEKVSQVCANSL
jgi:hypothetical protein